MTMLPLVFRQSFDQEVQQFLKKQDVKSFPEVPKVVGIGQSGARTSLFAWPGHNSISRCVCLLCLVSACSRQAKAGGLRIQDVTG
jgi:hypothetical protein